MGDVLFDASNNPQTSNAARGDVNSVNLRSLGVGNTLVLLNGRRLVQHPTSQGTSDTGTVPVLSYNSNAIPVAGLERLEVLLRRRRRHLRRRRRGRRGQHRAADRLRRRHRRARATAGPRARMREFEANVFAARTSTGGNVSLFLNYTDRTALLAADQDLHRDRRPASAVRRLSAISPAADRRSTAAPRIRRGRA